METPTVNGKDDGSKLPNTIPVRKREVAQRFANAVQQAIDRRRVPVVQAPRAVPARVSARAASRRLIADELAKLAQLRDSGVLTEDEFKAHKAKLLA
jgi:hypothetical protein